MVYFGVKKGWDYNMFYHLDVHTEYSLLNSIFKLEDIKKSCNDMGYDGVGVCDFNTLHKAYTFQNILKKGECI